MEIFIPAIISAVTSLAVVIVTYVMTSRREARLKEQQERERVNLEYLNPLRLYLVENYFRLREILARVQQGNGRCAWLLYVEHARDVSSQSAEWFNGEGAYLISSSYLTACLFCYMSKVRQDFPYLRLADQGDTKLLTLMLKVNLGFLKELGIFYVTQPSIGNDLYSAQENRLLTYREFCQVLQDPGKRVWFDRLLTYYLETGQGQHLERVEQALAAMLELSNFLDQVVGGGSSIKDRLEAEGIRSL
jgi:hypothetical protein